MTDAILRERLQSIAQKDRVAALFGMQVEDAGYGFARISAVVKEEFLNAHDLAHGAFVFALADVAFALAVNSVTDAVGVQWSINLFRPATCGDKITAECRLIHQGRRLMVVELVVRNQEEKLIAQGQATALPWEAGREAS
ncbi:MAG: PaaI family thioesterase [Thermoleophilia bacterium]|nr:PaaI family thioesterase [Thermoleophilia bacterium]